MPKPVRIRITQGAKLIFLGAIALFLIAWMDVAIRIEHGRRPAKMIERASR